MKKTRFFCLALALLLLFMQLPLSVSAGDIREVRIEFTHDIHSYLDVTQGIVEGTVRERGGISRLATLLQFWKDDFGGENVVYLDGGDFSQGTLFQAGYETNASELLSLAALGCAATTPGNHEWDHAGTGYANMLNTAIESGVELPAMLCSNLDFSGELTDEQAYVYDTLNKYAATTGQESLSTTVITTENGLRLGLFALSGISSIEDSPTSGMKWLDRIESAKQAVSELSGKCDIIICLSHCGTDGNGATGEDIELAQACPEINMILSAHSHSFYHEPVYIGSTLIASAGEYLDYMGRVDAAVYPDGTVEFSNYSLEPIDETVARDWETQAMIDGFKADLQETYLAEYGYTYDEIIAHCGFDFISLQDMYATHDEYPMGDLIADSYLYEARKNGINDIDVALVGLGTIRGAFSEGDITTADAFEICSLGVGADGSAGHPLLSAYITGKELKLLVELDASLGPMVSSIKMSYSGLSYRFNTKRMILDRVTDLVLVREDGTEEEIENDRLYKVCCNMYAANMLGMLNGLTKGILSITPKYADGTAVSDFYTCSLLNTNGNEIKEWVAFADYLNSFEPNSDGVPEISEDYSAKQGRKVKVAEGGLSAVKHPGTVTWIVCILGWLIIAAVFFITRGIVRSVRKRKLRKAGTP